MTDNENRNNDEHLQALQIGKKLKGEYLIEKILGQGGFGITYMATDIALKSRVAIKEFFPSSLAVRDATSEVRSKSGDHSKDYEWALKKFILEAQTLAQFKHENIVRIHRIFEENNTAYIVLEYVDGQNMEQWLASQQTRISQDQLDQLLLPLMDALKTIHKNDILHRDIKPANIYIKDDGTPVLLDFGAAYDTSRDTSISSIAVASQGFSPYECYTLDKDTRGPWTDIYSLSATVYRALTGKPPQDAISRVGDNTSYKPLAKIFSGSSEYRSGFLKSIDNGLMVFPQERPQSVKAWEKTLFEPEKPGARTAGIHIDYDRFTPKKQKRSQLLPRSIIGWSVAAGVIFGTTLTFASIMDMPFTRPILAIFNEAETQQQAVGLAQKQQRVEEEEIQNNANASLSKTKVAAVSSKTNEAEITRQNIADNKTNNQLVEPENKQKEITEPQNTPEEVVKNIEKKCLDTFKTITTVKDYLSLKYTYPDTECSRRVQQRITDICNQTLPQIEKTTNIDELKNISERFIGTNTQCQQSANSRIAELEKQTQQKIAANQQPQPIQKQQVEPEQVVRVQKGQSEKTIQSSLPEQTAKFQDQETDTGLKEPLVKPAEEKNIDKNAALESQCELQLQSAGNDIDIISTIIEKYKDTAKFCAVNAFTKLNELKKNSNENIRRVAQIQSFLKKAGCYYGRVDNIWGPRIRRALVKFGRQNKIRLRSYRPTVTILEVLEDNKHLKCITPRRKIVKPKPKKKIKRRRPEFAEQYEPPRYQRERKQYRSKPKGPNRYNDHDCNALPRDQKILCDLGFKNF